MLAIALHHCCFAHAEFDAFFNIGRSVGSFSARFNGCISRIIYIFRETCMSSSDVSMLAVMAWRLSSDKPLSENCRCTSASTRACNLAIVMPLECCQCIGE